MESSVKENICNSKQNYIWFGEFYVSNPKGNYFVQTNEEKM